MKLIVIVSAILLLTLPAWAGTFLADFDKGNLNEWQEFNMRNAPDGTWKIINDELHAVSPDAAIRLLTIGDETWRDYTIEFDVKLLRKRDRGNITVAARITGDWAAWCMIGDDPFGENISMAAYSAGNFREPTPFIIFDSEPHRPMNMNEWSKLKLDVAGNTLNLWINGEHVLGPARLPNRQSFKNFDAARKQHLKEHHADDENWQFRPMPLGNFQDLLTGGVGIGLSNHTARFDNIVITGESIPGIHGLPVEPKAKLATLWGNLKRL